MRLYQNTQFTNMTDINVGVQGQFQSEPDLQAIFGDAYIGLLNSVGNIGQVSQTVAEQTINRIVFRDNPRLNQTLTRNQTTASITEIIRQMKVAGATVLAMTVTSTPTGFFGTGNGAVVSSVRRPSDGAVLENSFAETVLLTCSTDSFSGSARSGNEIFSVTGTGTESSPFDFNWPLGSNGRMTIAAINGQINNGQGNLLTNSNFPASAWTLALGAPSKLAGWTFDVGPTLFNLETGIVFTGTGALRITGDGATNAQMRQQFSSSAGTRGAMIPSASYGFNCFMRRDGVAPGAGILTIDLVDQNTNTIRDNAGNLNTFNIDLTQLTVNYAPFNVTFRTPEALPSSVFLRFRLSTPLTNNRNVYMDLASLGQQGQLYTGGPFFSVHSASQPFTIGDFATCVITNSRGAAGTLNTFQTLFYRLMQSQVAGNEFILPSSATPTIQDSLI